MIGDLLFYAGGSDVASRVVELVTSGRFVHVEVDVGSGFAIGALSAGISRHPLVPPTARYTVPNLSSVADGLAWLAEQVTQHDEYGYINLFDALPRLPVTLDTPGHYDCSSLATRFVLHAGGAAWLGRFADSPDSTSPNDLARLAGLE